MISAMASPTFMAIPPAVDHRAHPRRRFARGARFHRQPNPRCEADATCAPGRPQGEAQGRPRGGSRRFTWPRVAPYCAASVLAGGRAMPPKTTEAEFEALVARAGVPLTAAQKAG